MAMKKFLVFLALVLPAIPALWVALEMMNFFRPQEYPETYSGMHPLAVVIWGLYLYFLIFTGEVLVLIFVQIVRGR